MAWLYRVRRDEQGNALSTPPVRDPSEGIDLAIDEDQQAIAELFGDFFGKECPPALVREAEPLGYDAALWERLNGLGAPAMAAPVERGGDGARLADLIIVAEAVGEAVAPVPLIEHLVTVRLTPDDDLVTGSTIGSIALNPADANGVWRLVPAGAVAGVVVGVDGDQLVAVRSEAPGRGPANHAAQPLADRSARIGDRTVLGPASAFTGALNDWRILTSAALLGMSKRALQLGVAYAKERHQFGVPIGGFQAIQHLLADLPGLIDGARLLTHRAAWATTLDPSEWVADADDNFFTDPSVLASMAFLFAGDAAALATDRSLHVHGGYGYTEEYDIQLYYRRARGWRLVAGSPAQERARLADLLLAGRPA